MSKPKVLIIIHDRYQEDNFFSLGTGYLAAVLKPYAQIDTYCMDVYHYTNKQLEQYLDENEYDLILLGYLAGRFNQTIRDLSKVIVKNKKNAWFVIGGHGVAPIPDYMLKETKADIATTGEAEESIIEILDAKINNKSLYNIDGIAFRNKDETIYINQKRQPIKDIDMIPFPAWEAFPMDIYTTNLQFPGMTKSDKAFGIIAGRGCFNNCSFCYRMEKGIRLRSIDNVIEEIKTLNKIYGINYFFFLDELFCVSENRIKEFTEKLRKNKLEILYNVNSRVDIFNKNIAKMLKDSGCMMVNIGFESSNQKVLDALNKKATVSQNIKTAELCYKYNLGMGINMLFGLPEDTIETLWNNVEFVKKWNLYDQCRTLRPPCPYPGSGLYYQAIEKGLLTGAEDFFNKFKNSDLMLVNFTDIPEKIYYEELFKANKELVLDHYQHTNQDWDTANKIIQGYKDLYEGRTTEFYGSRSDTTNEDKRKIVK